MAPTSANKKVVLITGANSGIGYEAALVLAKMDNTHVIVTGRSAERVQAAVDKIQPDAASTSSVEAGLLDLGSVKAIQAYANQIKERGLTIDALMCNGGVTMSQKTFTTDGYESIFGINHLGHFYLVELLRDITRRIVIISSETHDPDEHTTSPPPRMAVSDVEQLAHGYEDFVGGEAYSTSKLCNLLLMKEFVRRFPNGPEFIAYTPGFTPTTGFLRELNVDVAKILMNCEEKGIPVSTPEASGGFMARLCVEDWAVNGWTSDMYIRVHTPYEPSKQSQDEELARTLWDKSEELVARALHA
ncbi:hypothetical protein Poli38472_004647 [Pythium oligandrum]|uniref:Protochlorophyllide reductase n=1 Tax=Pythium oligandrum TaxID=41045 RepID=A0A8K1FIB5_PYTOL|nr:hypothetical protein Poli38472_004647 [Pythium oligandrum]|eukprot:TMW59578.1 hypothetical protein Poli38472_004647 [Pythium oligandrum]